MYCVYIYIYCIYILYIYIYCVYIYMLYIYIYIVYRERETTSTVYCPHSVTSRPPRLVLLWHFETAQRQGISTLVTTSLPSGIFWQVLKMHGYFLERLFSWSYCLSPRNEVPKILSSFSEPKVVWIQFSTAPFYFCIRELFWIFFVAILLTNSDEKLPALSHFIRINIWKQKFQS